jgi:hypothetical protein
LAAELVAEELEAVGEEVPEVVNALLEGVCETKADEDAGVEAGLLEA